MPLSTPKPKFLLDENVRIELYKFLKEGAFDIKIASKGVQDTELISISKREGRILVTNDQDFCDYAEDEVFCVVWLRIPQHDPEALISSFSKLLKEAHKFTGRLIVLETGRWEEFPLPMTIKSK